MRITRRLGLLAIVGLAAAIVGYNALVTARAEHHEMSANVKVAKELLEAFNTNNWDALTALVTEDTVLHEYGTQRTIEGRDAVLEVVKAWKTAFPDGGGVVNAHLEGGNSVAFEVMWHGTQTGPLMTPDGEIPPSGESHKTPGAWVVDVEDGKVTEVRSYFDVMTLLQQIGAAPGTDADDDDEHEHDDDDEDEDDDDDEDDD